MHPLLENLSVFSWMEVINSNETCIYLLEDLGLIPKKTDIAPACPKCLSPNTLKVLKCGTYKLGWHWKCEKRKKEKKDRCVGMVNPLDGTFFRNRSIPLKDILALLFGFLLKLGVTDFEDHINCWRKSREEKKIGSQTIVNFYSQFKEIILIVLRKKGDSSKNLEKANIVNLLQKYSRMNEIQPCFRNLVFQFLMDMKSIYPLRGNKAIGKHVDTSASTSISSADHAKKAKYSNISLTSLKNDKNQSCVPITSITSTSISTAKTISENSFSSNSTSVSNAGETLPVHSENMDIESMHVLNYNSTMGNALNSNNSTVIKETEQASNNKTTSVMNAMTANKNATVSDIEQISNNNIKAAVKRVQTPNTSTAIIENAQTSDNSTAGTENVENLNNPIVTNSPLSASMGISGEKLNEATLFGTDLFTFNDENFYEEIVETIK